MRQTMTAINPYGKQFGFLWIVALLFATTIVSAQTEVQTITAPFNGSGDVSLGPDDNLYVGDFGIFLNQANGTTVKRIAPDGSVSVFANGLAGASGNEFDPAGNLYQSNIAGERVSKITPDGAVSTLSSTNITAPVGIAIDTAGNVYSTNCISTAPASITKTTPAGVSTIFVTSSLLNCPNGLTIDEKGNLYACNFGNGWIVKITPQGVASNLAFIEGNNNGHITYSNGYLYVVARCANKIFEVSLDGDIRHIAGNGARGKADGPALQASFSLPNGITASRTGDTLFVNDATSLTGTCATGALNPVVIRMITNVLTDIPSEPQAPVSRFQLKQNYPNPFNPTTNVEFGIRNSEWVNLVVYDLLGRYVKTLLDQRMVAGNHTAVWDGTNEYGHAVGSGTYYYRLRVGNQSEVRKMLLTR